MTVEQMRSHLLNLMPYAESTNWRSRVRKWPDKQVIAVYYKFLEQGKFDKKKPKTEKTGRQMTLDEFLPASEVKKL